MRTVKLANVLQELAKSCGIVPGTDDYTEEFLARLVGWVNLRLPEAWFRHRWPELMLVEERQFAADWAAGTAYAEDEIVFYDDVYWIALQATTGNTPATGSAYWEETSDYDALIEFDQAWATNEIERFATITDRDPRKSRSPLRYLFRIDGDGAWVTSQAGVTVWVKFWPACPEFSSTLWEEGTTYAADDLVYSETTGECYKAKQASTNVDPATDTTETYWGKVAFPKFLQRWVNRAVRAEYFRDDNQDDKAEQQDGLAELAMGTLYDEEMGGQDQDEEPVRMSGYGVNKGAF
jgi:hypothetical protein